MKCESICALICVLSLGFGVLPIMDLKTFSVLETLALLFSLIPVGSASWIIRAKLLYNGSVQWNPILVAAISMFGIFLELVLCSLKFSTKVDHIVLVIIGLLQLIVLICFAVLMCLLLPDMVLPVVLSVIGLFMTTVLAEVWYGQPNHQINELNHKFNELNHKFNELNHKFNELNHKFNELDHKLDRLMEAINGRPPKPSFETEVQSFIEPLSDVLARHHRTIHDFATVFSHHTNTSSVHITP
ncbi:hypothetical protein P9112_000388 [Eukaryota sp. TZLM1-RC]